MQYLLMIYEDEAHYEAPGAMEAIVAKHRAFGQQQGAALQGGNGLQPASMATTVRTSGVTQTIHDGPFAETKEQLGGYYVIDVADLDAAIAVAKAIPMAGDGTIEVRPILTQG